MHLENIRGVNTNHVIDVFTSEQTRKNNKPVTLHLKPAVLSSLFMFADLL